MIGLAVPHRALFARAALLIACAMMVFSAPFANSAKAAELVMLEQPGCYWCISWHEKIGPIYPKTADGQRAPLRPVNIRQPWPADLAGIRSDVYTPTFVLVDKGREIGRIRGFPGEDFFWGLLAEMTAKLPGTEAEAETGKPSGPARELGGSTGYGPVLDNSLRSPSLKGEVQANLLQ